MVGSYESTNCPCTNCILSDDLPANEQRMIRKKYFGIKKSKKKIQTKNRRIENIPEKLKLSKKS